MSTRAPFQVLVLPYHQEQSGVRYAVFRRKARTGGYWQFIAGGGDGRETAVRAARREAFEEAGISPRSKLIRLDASAMIPVEHVHGFHWGRDVLVIPEFCFGIEMVDTEIRLSDEHAEFRCGGTPRDGGLGQTGRKSGECRFSGRNYNGLQTHRKLRRDR